jgi:hypothetical protein
MPHETTPHIQVAAVFDHDRPISLPVWHRELERQFYRWLPRESWPTDSLTFTVDPQAQDGRRPCLCPVLWVRFFLWRYQRGFGPVTFFAKLALATSEVDSRIIDVRRAITQQALVPEGPETVAHTLALVYAPFYAVFETLDVLKPEHLWHRETLKKLRRLRLL